MITIHSTEEERYSLLKDRILTVEKWDESKALKIIDAEESIAKALKRHARELEIVGKTTFLENITEPVKITMETIKESIASMTKQHANLIDLSKMLTIFDMVFKNAILINVEEYRHVAKPQRADSILGEYQYLSAFYDDSHLYPVKIVAERRKNPENSNVYVTMTIGNILMKDLKKEESSIHRMHPQIRGESSGSGRNPSFDIMLTQLLEYFNKDQAVLLKNLPDKLLNENQQEIKNNLIAFDKEKELTKLLSRYQTQIINAVERGETVLYKAIPHNFVHNMRKAMINSGICFMEAIDADNQYNIITLEKNENSFLHIQKKVFGYEISKNQNRLYLDKTKEEQNNMTETEQTIEL